MRDRKILYPILQSAVRDEWFQQCWRSAAVAEDRLAPIRDSLTEDQQQILDDYLAAREELGLAMVSVGYEMGAENAAGDQTAEGEWLWELFDRAMKDTFFQTCDQDLKEREPDYRAILDSLPEASRKQLVDYVFSCCAHGSALAAVAYELGVEHGKCGRPQG